MQVGERLKRTGVQLIAVTNPFQTSLGDIVERNEVVVARHAMYRLYTDLFQSCKEVLTHIS
jgi:hypothetical protein